MSLIQELRDARAKTIGEAMGSAHENWKKFVTMAQEAVRRGLNEVLLAPADGTPFARAVSAAVAVQAEAEGFKVERVKRQAATMLGDAKTITCWRISW
jgi:hypothetical protein